MRVGNSNRHTALVRITTTAMMQNQINHTPRLAIRHVERQEKSTPP